MVDKRAPPDAPHHKQEPGIQLVAPASVRLDGLPDAAGSMAATRGPGAASARGATGGGAGGGCSAATLGAAGRRAGLGALTSLGSEAGSNKARLVERIEFLAVGFDGPLATGPGVSFDERSTIRGADTSMGDGFGAGAGGTIADATANGFDFGCSGAGAGSEVAEATCVEPPTVERMLPEASATSIGMCGLVR